MCITLQMTSRFGLILLIAALCCVSALAAPGDAFIVLRKQIHTDHVGVLAVGTPFTVQLTAFNVGKQYVSSLQLGIARPDDACCN